LSTHLGLVCESLANSGKGEPEVLCHLPRCNTSLKGRADRLALTLLQRRSRNSCPRPHFPRCALRHHGSQNVRGLLECLIQLRSVVTCLADLALPQLRGGLDKEPSQASVGQASNVREGRHDLWQRSWCALRH
jgi:hypothetical protein